MTLFYINLQAIALALPSSCIYMAFYQVSAVNYFGGDERPGAGRLFAPDHMTGRD